MVWAYKFERYPEDAKKTLHKQRKSEFLVWGGSCTEEVGHGPTDSWIEVEGKKMGGLDDSLLNRSADVKESYRMGRNGRLLVEKESCVIRRAEGAFGRKKNSEYL